MMLTKAQQKIIKSLHRKKGRKEHGLCLVEGGTVVDEAKEYLEYSFVPEDASNFEYLVTTETPQDVAGVARIPEYTLDDIKAKSTIVLLDGVQDPGNVGTILRLCLGFNASVLLIESADVASPKVIRSSVGALFHVPWMQVARDDIQEVLEKIFEYQVVRLEKRPESQPLQEVEALRGNDSKVLLIAGSEGKGIQVEVEGDSVMIEHSDSLESLNVAASLAISLYQRFI